MRSSVLAEPLIAQTRASASVGAFFGMLDSRQAAQGLHPLQRVDRHYGAWRKIPEEDIEALKGFRHTKP
jgi:hypothetical protein